MAEGSSVRAELLIRSPSVDTPADFSIRASMEQTISEVKAAIEREHSQSPSSRDMRIIWKGRILQDTVSVRKICENESTGECCLQQTLHFVVGMPMSPRSPIHQQQTTSSDAKPVPDIATSSAASAEGAHIRRGATAALPTVVPLSNRFQYVLVDGVPYLMELRPPVSTHSNIMQQLTAPPILNRYGAATTTHGMRAASPGHIPGPAGARAFSQLYDRAMARTHEAGLHGSRLHQGADAQAARPPGTAGGAGAGIGAVAAQPAVPAPGEGAEVRRREAANAVPLADLLRGFGFSTVWSFFLMVLRLLLLVVVLAHDASMERLFALVCVIAIVAALRSSWVHRHMQWLNDFNRGAAQPSAEQHERPREYSALEKARALVIALFTSLVPSEPFQIPAADA
ncbi:hypothetical protein H4R20_000768 [Coemansia guatemalensis]|uniref:Ubiquitin-like domain-containing protein n=1 Tax=Coemansia guatemalensis TaxID=2761395 RepID=A0A9W8HYA3_9FUNG|nr:hypothetical protein H4R20_000768 [Coemansia guatemalensis]